MDDKMTQRNNILQELTELNSSLAAAEPVNPYVVPGGYFENLLPAVLKKIRAMDSANAADEIGNLSPLLAGLKKEMPFSVPAGYFENVSAPAAPQARIISLDPRKWFRYAAAVVVVGLLIASGILFMRNRNEENWSLARIEKTVSKEIGRMSDVELSEFLQYTDAGLNGEEKVNVTPGNDIKELLEDIPVSELKEFIEETSDFETEEVLMN